MNSLIQATPAKPFSTSWASQLLATTLIVLIAFLGFGLSEKPAYAENSVPLGHVANVSVFANIGLINNGTSTISGDVDVHTSTSLLGLVLPVGISLNGLVNLGNSTTTQVKADCDAIYAHLSARPINATLNAELGGTTLFAGVYVADVLRVNGVLTLDAQGDSNAIFILKANANLNVGANAVIKLINGANSNNVFWQVGGNADIGVAARFAGRLFAHASIVANTGASIRGSLLSCGAGVELNGNTINSAASIGATVPTPAIDVPAAPQAVSDVVDPGGVLATETSTTQPITDEQAADAIVMGSSASDDRSKTSASGLLAYTGRNAETIIPIALALLGIGWATAATVYRRRHAVTDQQL